MGQMPLNNPPMLPNLNMPPGKPSEIIKKY